MTPIRYAAAACQTDLPNPRDRAEMRANTDRMVEMIDHAVAGSAPFLPVRLIVFPEFAHAAPIYPTVAELTARLAVPVPNEHTERIARKARQHEVYVQTGSMIESGSAMAGRAVQHDVSHRSRGPALQIPKGEPLDPVRGAYEPARPARL